jgi:hypothetical protein
MTVLFFWILAIRRMGIQVSGAFACPKKKTTRRNRVALFWYPDRLYYSTLNRETSFNKESIASRFF